MYLEKNNLISKGYHKKWYVRFNLSLQNKFKPFHHSVSLRRNKLLNKTNSLRSQTIISKKNLFVRINYNNSLLLLKIAVQFIVNYVNNKILTLFCSSNGIFFYKISTTKENLFKFSKLYQLNLNKKFKLRKILAVVSTLKRLRKISLVPNILGESKLVRSVGVSAKIIKINKENNLVTILLPSKKFMIITSFAIVAIGSIKKLYKKKLPCTYAGYKRLLGYKPLTRGVAMNPVDHPHGGNTNSICLHRTP